MNKGLNNNSLKIIAIIAMVLDHVAHAFISLTSPFYYIFRIVGRITAPIMFFSLANGYKYTRNKVKYGLRLFSFALISQIPFSLFLENKVFLYDKYNIIFTLFLGFLCLCFLYNIKNIFLKILGVLSCFILSYFCEYGLFAIGLIVLFSLCENDRLKMLFYSFMCVFYITMRFFVNTMNPIGFLLYMGLFLAIPLFNLYSGQRGKYNLKYFFYVFYPVQFLVLFFVKTFFM